MRVDISASQWSQTHSQGNSPLVSEKENKAEWPSQSPDLNPNNNLWKKLKIRAHRRGPSLVWHDSDTYKGNCVFVAVLQDGPLFLFPIWFWFCCMPLTAMFVSCKGMAHAAGDSTWSAHPVIAGVPSELNVKHVSYLQYLHHWRLWLDWAQ